jgi:hypothetical protein
VTSRPANSVPENAGFALLAAKGQSGKVALGPQSLSFRAFDCRLAGGVIFITSFASNRPHNGPGWFIEGRCGIYPRIGLEDSGMARQT